jgi:hypothetical protein
MLSLENHPVAKEAIPCSLDLGVGIKCVIISKELTEKGVMVILMVATMVS